MNLLRLVLYVTSLPVDLLLAWPMLLVTHVFWGEKLYWEDDALVSLRREGSWLDRKWRFSTSIGHAISYHSSHVALEGEPMAAVQIHEHVHVEQSEAAMLGSFLVAVTQFAVLGEAWWWLCVLVWATGNLVWALSGWLTAILRGENAYRGAHFEEAAYAIDEVHTDNRPALRPPTAK